MVALVSVLELEEWLPDVSLSVEQSVRAEAILVAVSSLVRSETGRTWEGEVVPADVAGIVKEIAAGIHRDPYGVVQEMTGPFSARYSEAARLALTAAHKTALHRYRSQQRGLWTMGVTRGDMVADTVYVPVEGTVAEFPWYAA